MCPRSSPYVAEKFSAAHCGSVSMRCLRRAILENSPGGASRPRKVRAHARMLTHEPGSTHADVHIGWPDGAAVPADGPLTSLPMPRAEATGDSGRRANWQVRRDAIVDKSASVFARRGYHATGITELCVANDLGKGALYHYIGSKEELLAAIHDRVMDEVMVGADRVAVAGGSPSKQLAMLGEELLDVIHRYPDHVWVFLHEFPALTGERATQFREQASRVRATGRGSPPGRRRIGGIPGIAPEADCVGMAGDAQLHLLVAQSRWNLVGSRRREALRRHLHAWDHKPGLPNARMNLS